MKTSLSGREPLNGAAEPGLDLLEIDVFDVKNPCERRIAAMSAGSKWLAQRSSIFSSCSVRSVTNSLVSSENVWGGSM
jgi:hypothetical protein